MADATPCQTPGAVFTTRIGKYGVYVNVNYGRTINLTADEAALLETNLHNAVELVLAPLWAVRVPQSSEDTGPRASIPDAARRAEIAATWPKPETTRDIDALRMWVMYGDYFGVFNPWHTLIETWEASRG